MKFWLILSTLIVSQLSFAQTLKEQRIKKEMLDRVEILIQKIQDTRDDLDKKDVESACSKIKEIFKIYPDHLVGIGSHLDIYRNRSVKARDRALHELIFIHKQTLICDQGADQECVDPEKLDKKLRSINRSLKRQRRTIKKLDTNNENSFQYSYEF